MADSIVTPFLPAIRSAALHRPRADPKAAAVYIIYTLKPRGNVESESNNIRLLTSVLGSDDAARKAIIYTYKNPASGFAAKLTPDQVARISAQPGVLQVVPSVTNYHLDSDLPRSRRTTCTEKLMSVFPLCVHACNSVCDAFY